MISWSDAFSLSLVSASLLSSLLGLWLAATTPGTDRWSKRFFLGYFSVLALCCFATSVEIALQYYPIPDAAVYVALALETLLLSLPLPLMTVYLLHCCGENWRSSKLMHAVIGSWAFFCILLASNQHTGIIGHVTPEHQFIRGPWYPLLLSPVIATLLLNLVGVIRRRNRLSPKVFRSFLIAQFPMTFALIVNLVIDALPFFDISFALAALSMFSLILSDQIEQDLRRQREIVRQHQEIVNQHAKILVLQMRPHFIYNTLMSIYSLCNIDPHKARQVTADFTDYLRKNFNAVANEGSVPFSVELKHARAYLAVEQAQYEDMLSVDYDAEFTRFRLPPLTLQPLVENAVKHGMNPYSGQLHITIRTRHTEAGSEVVVEDNGLGFDAALANDPRATLANIRQRLEMMCGGTLEIAPREGGGAVVRVTIPEQE